MNSTQIEIWQFKLTKDLHAEEVLTALSLFGSACLVLLGWIINERQKKNEHEREYADRIRNSAVTFLTKLEWRKELNRNIYRDIQPVINKTESLFTEERDAEKSSHFFWNELSIIFTKYNMIFINEQLEMSYKDLYSYAPITNDLYSVLNEFKYIDSLAQRILLRLNQNEIYKRKRSLDKSILTEEMIEKDEIEEYPFLLGNKMRYTCVMIAYLYEHLIEELIEPFRDKMIYLIKEEDHQIYHKKEIKSPASDDRLKAHYWALKGLAACSDEKYKDAHDYFCIAIKLTPNIPGLYAGKGLTLQALGFNRQAQIAFKEAINRYYRLFPQSNPYQKVKHERRE